MGFQDVLKQLQSKAETGSRGNNADSFNPLEALENPRLFISKKQPEVLVRILPGVAGKEFARPVKKASLRTESTKGNPMSIDFVWNLEDGTDDSKELEVFSTWLQQDPDGKKVPGAFGPMVRPQLVYYLNVLPLESTPDGQITHKTDDQGRPFVQMLQIPATAFAQLAKQLGDPMNKPQGTGEESFASESNAYPVKIGRSTGEGVVQYSVNIYQNFQLGQLPQGWDAVAPDLDYQSTPVSESNPEYFQSFVNRWNDKIGLPHIDMGGTVGGAQQANPVNEQATNNFFNPGQQQAPQQPVQPQAPVQPPVQQQQADPFGNQDPFATTSQPAQPQSNETDLPFTYGEEPNTQPQEPQAPQAPQQPVNNGNAVPEPEMVQSPDIEELLRQMTGQ